jgi:hypothetical protein
LSSANSSVENEYKHKRLQKRRLEKQIDTGESSEGPIQSEITFRPGLFGNTTTTSFSSDGRGSELQKSSVTTVPSSSQTSAPSSIMASSTKQEIDSGPLEDKLTRAPPHSLIARRKRDNIPLLRRFFHKKATKDIESESTSSSGNSSTQTKSRPTELTEAVEEILDSSALGTGRETLSREERWIQKDSDVVERILWAESDRKTLFDYIDEMRKYIGDLEALLRLKETAGAPLHPDALKERAKSLEGAVKDTQSALQRLHTSLRAMNKRNNPWKFSLQLAENYDEAGKDFVNLHDYLPLRTGSIYFMLQRHAPKSDRHSELYVAETILNPPVPRSAAAATIAPLATNLEQSKEYRLRPNGNPFAMWGSIRTEKSRDDLHCLFQDAENKWATYGTLADIFKELEASQKMTTNQRIKLALVVASSYMYLLGVRDGCDPIGLHSFKYYSLEGENTSWDNEDPLVLYPYLSFGFGQRPTDVIVGGKAKTRRNHETVIFELGIILVQIGCCQATATAKDAGLSATRSWALTHLHELECYVTLPYAEIARDCLEYSIPSFLQEGQKKEIEFLTDIVARLGELRQGLIGTVAGDMIPL